MEKLNNLTQTKKFVYTFFALALVSPLIGFVYKINLSNLFGPMEFNLYLLKFGIYTKNGGVVSDLVTHWKYILALRENLQNLILYTMGEDTNLINFPLHNIIFSQFYILTENIKNYLNFYFVFSMLMPFFFYLCLREKFKEINKLILLIFSSII